MQPYPPRRSPGGRRPGQPRGWAPRGRAHGRRRSLKAGIAEDRPLAALDVHLHEVRRVDQRQHVAGLGGARSSPPRMRLGEERACLLEGDLGHLLAAATTGRRVPATVPRPAISIVRRKLRGVGRVGLDRGDPRIRPSRRSAHVSEQATWRAEVEHPQWLTGLRERGPERRLGCRRARARRSRRGCRGPTCRGAAARRWRRRAAGSARVGGRAAQLAQRQAARNGRPCAARSAVVTARWTLRRPFSQRSGAVDPRRPSSPLSPPRRGSRARRRRRGRSRYRRSRSGGAEACATPRRARRRAAPARVPPPSASLGLGHHARRHPGAAREACPARPGALLALRSSPARVIAWSWWTTSSGR